MRMLTLGAALALPVLAISGCASNTKQACGEPISQRDGTPRQVTVLGDDLAPVRDAFNRASDRWRVVALVSPTCSECVLGAEAVQKEITRRYSADDVAAIIVWIPMLETDSENAARVSATIFAPQRASQFYDSHQNVGWEYARQTFAGFQYRARKSLPDGHRLAEAFDDLPDERPQWDLYMLYAPAPGPAPGIRWEATSNGPPMPTHWIRHVGRMEDRKTSTYWRDSPESGPREGDLFQAMRQMADEALGSPSAAMNSKLKIEVLGFTDCRNAPATMTNVNKAVAAMGLSASVAYVDQEKLPEGDSRRGWPSPTVLVDGRDLFDLPAPKGMAMRCRLYPHVAPSEAEITTALESLTRR